MHSPYPAIEKLLTHRPPILMVDRLVMADSNGVVAERIFSVGDYGAVGHRVLAGALVELAAQTVAALHGIESFRLERSPVMGMLIGVEDFEIWRSAQIGERIEVIATVTRRLGPFFLADVTLRQAGEAIAGGCLKFFVQDETTNAQETT